MVRNTLELSKLYKLNILLQEICPPPLSRFNHARSMIRGWGLWSSGDNCYILSPCKEPLLSHTVIHLTPHPGLCTLSKQQPTYWLVSHEGLAQLYQ